MRERMGSVDAAWFHMDRPENTADVVSLLTFRQAPAYERVRALVDDRLLRYDRFRQRPAGGVATADAWEDDPDFDVERHLVRHRLASRSPRALRDVVSAICTERLDPAHPLWRIHLVEGAQGAFVAKLHHALADGFALVALMLTLADEPVTAPESRNAAEAYRRLAPWLDLERSLRAALKDPVLALNLGVGAAGMAAALVRMALHSRAPDTVLSRKLSGQRRAAWSHGLPLERVKQAAHAHGGTLNDLVMAAIAGALRSHLAARGERVDTFSIRAMVPVNLRPGAPEASRGVLGNRFGLVYLDLPTDLRTPRARLEAMRARSAAMKTRPDSVATYGVLGALGLLPPIEPWATSFFSSKASLVVTNVPGPREALHLAGERVDHAMFWVPHLGALGLGVSVLSYAGELRIGVRADTAVMDDPADLVHRFEAELEALGVAAPRRRNGAARRAPRANGHAHASAG